MSRGDLIRRRLQQAALELFQERGFDRTTSAEIAERAGVTERTFFRHFSDKREVFFDGQTALVTALEKAVAEAPKDLGALDVLFHAFQAVERMLEENRPFTEPRVRLIATEPALQERASAKTAALNAALATALRARGVEARLATLAAQSGMAVFTHAAASWFDDPSKPLHDHLVRAFSDLNAMCSRFGRDFTSE